MQYYAQIDSDGVAVGIQQSIESIDSDAVVEIPEEDYSLLGKRFENGVFVDMPQPEPAPIREISIEAFYDRIGMDKIAAIVSSQNPQVMALYAYIQSRKTSINLDSDKMPMALALLQAEGIVSEADKEAICADGQPHEAP